MDISGLLLHLCPIIANRLQPCATDSGSRREPTCISNILKMLYYKDIPIFSTACCAGGMCGVYAFDTDTFFNLLPVFFYLTVLFFLSTCQMATIRRKSLFLAFRQRNCKMGRRLQQNANDDLRKIFIIQRYNRQSNAVKWKIKKIRMVKTPSRFHGMFILIKTTIWTWY